LLTTDSIAEQTFNFERRQANFRFPPMHDFRYVGKKLFCEGVAVESLAEKFGTPLYVYSQRTLTRHFQALDRAMSPLPHLVCFAMKSNSNQSVIRTLANLGSGFDIVSGGELQRVIAAG